MKIRFILTIIAVISSFYPCSAQYDDKKVLMTVAGRDAEAGEFVRMYRKSIDPSGTTDLEEYLGQFIAFKLKVAEAIEIGYDTTKAFRDELSGYRSQLARSYLTDPDIRERLLDSARERYPMEVNASHILVSCRPDASPDDTLLAWNKAYKARMRIMDGEDFNSVAREISDDRSVGINGGNIGYFSVFQMIRPFEDAAFTLPAGSVSMPVRTAYGYHIIKVNDKRPSTGKIRVAHIMKAIPQGSDEQKVKQAGDAIEQIYSRLQKGESFSRLASELSDHKESAKNGGEMNWFGTGEIISDFAEPAFAIKDTGEYTLPVRTAYGFHIIRLLERKPQTPWDEIRPVFEARINQSDIDARSKRSFVAKLKKEYGFRIDKKIHDWFVKNTDSLIMQGKARYDARKIPSGNIFSYAGKYLSAREFASFLENRPAAYGSGNPGYFIDSSIDAASTDELLKYEDSVLENKYPDFRYLMKEFHDGILLFDISSDKIWNRIQDDTTGIRNFYKSNPDKFTGNRLTSALNSDKDYKPVPLPFDEVQAEVISGYQDWLTEQWIKQLKEKYNVKVDSSVYKEVRKTLIDE